MRAAMVALALSVAPPAAAQTPPLPQEFVSVGDMSLFQSCRAAVFFHLDGPPDPASIVPRTLARTLLDQINFIMAETIFAKPRGTLDDGVALLGWTESWFIGFSRKIGEDSERFADVAERDRTLIGCAPIVWSIARFYVDALAAWRTAADRTPPEMTPEQAQALRLKTEQTLGLRE